MNEPVAAAEVEADEAPLPEEKADIEQTAGEE
jgi:hypothetical protein